MISKFSIPVVAGLLLLNSPGLYAQNTIFAGVIGGVSQYDLSGTGVEPFIGVRFDFVPHAVRFVVLEAGLQYFAYETDTGDQRRHWFPEASVQVQVPGKHFRPYIGVGGGISVLEGASDPTLSASLGSRVILSQRWHLRTELRLRSVDPWVGTTADWGLGVSRAL